MKEIMFTRCPFPAGGIFRIAALFTFICSICAIAIPLRADSPNGSSAEQRTKTYEWFNTLGYPDVKDLKFVRVTTAETGFVDNMPRPRIVHGFLIAAAKDNFKVFVTTTEISSFKKAPAKAPARFSVGYDTDDLVQYATVTLKSLRKPKPEGSQRNPIARYWETQEATEVFVLSWSCWRKGYDALAAELFDEAAKLPLTREGSPTFVIFQTRLAADLSFVEYHRALNDFSNFDIPRSQLLTRLENFAKTVPASDESTQARELATALKPLVREDEDHSARLAYGKPFEQLAKKDQIAELIFQLRNYVGFRDGKQTVAERLDNRGYEAVPQLIAALADKRLSRMVYLDYRDVHVLTIGDAAAEILSRIACREFGEGLSPLSDPTHDESRLADFKKEAEAWYAEASRKGEKRMLIEATEKGDDDCLASARRLAEKYPDAAVNTIANGIGNADDGDVRRELFNCLAMIPGDGPIPFLLRELKKGKSLADRVVAAEILHEHNRDECIPAMIDEWKHSNGSEHPEELDELVQFLASCGKVEAIKSLADGLGKRPVGFRFAVVFAFDGISAFRAAGSPAAKPPREWSDAVVNLLLAALDDTDDDFQSWTSSNGPGCSNARVCDVAAYDLNQLDSKRFPFDVSGTWAQRDRSLVSLKNALRKQRGLPPLPVPEVRKTVQIAADKLKPLLDRLEQAPAQQSENFPANVPLPAAILISREIEKLGAGALAGTLDRLKSLDPHSPHRPAFDRLARRLASSVVEIQVGEKSLKPDDAIKSKLESFKGKPLDPSALAEVLGSLATDLRPPAYGVKFFVSRAAGEAGTTLRVDIIDKSRAISLGKWVNRAGAQADEKPYFQTTIDVAGARNGGSRWESGPLDESVIRQAFERVPLASPSDKVEVGLEIIPQ
jgi:hypothetical protein